MYLYIYIFFLLSCQSQMIHGEPNVLNASIFLSISCILCQSCGEAKSLCSAERCTISTTFSCESRFISKLIFHTYFQITAEQQHFYDLHKIHMLRYHNKGKHIQRVYRKSLKENHHQQHQKHLQHRKNLKHQKIKLKLGKLFIKGLKH